MYYIYFCHRQKPYYAIDHYWEMMPGVYDTKEEAKEALARFLEFDKKYSPGRWMYTIRKENS